MNQQTPLFYKEPIALNKEVHSKLTVGKNPDGYAFASGTHNVILASVEFYEACKEYPIIFTTTPNDKIVPIALLGFREGENLFVDEDGVWAGRYIPAYVRRYPFILAETGRNELTVCFDQAYEGLNSEDGATLFDSEGGYSPYMQQTLGFLRNYHDQYKNNEAFTNMVKELDLFKPMDALVELNDGRKYALNGFMVVDEQKLQAIGEDDLYALFKDGYLSLIYAHLLSLSTMSGLLDKLAAKNN